ncbi:MAG: heavy-metal-associated domain-containing protein [Proteobacteria bacterium]|nr:heavy-metal-associated domain-containing protein [Pseudomonadota bacterium]MBU1687991.1 heavy-metal-associated domain-containing protein [Pseudomonadota bacterium]
MDKKMKFGLAAAALAALVVFSISFVSAGANDSGKGYTETVFKVDNLSCGACLADIESELKQLGRIEGLTGDLGRGLVAVRHSDDFTPERIMTAITAAGYPSRLATSEELAAGPPSSRGSGCGSRGCGSGGCGVAPPAEPAG